MMGWLVGLPLGIFRIVFALIMLAVRLAVCRLCLPDKPPILLDDALAAFDDQRLTLALDLLRELAREQQILLFTCQKREGEALSGAQNVTYLTL